MPGRRPNSHISDGQARGGDGRFTRSARRCPTRTYPGRHLSENDPAYLSRFTQLVPIDRLGDAREVAEVALYLASDAASYVSGAEIAVCCALTA
jgi:NAD(P)-dependent dehydrogenase (short-subunit alcohol dehydrogenase family)